MDTLVRKELRARVIPKVQEQLGANFLLKNTSKSGLRRLRHSITLNAIEAEIKIAEATLVGSEWRNIERTVKRKKGK